MRAFLSRLFRPRNRRPSLFALAARVRELDAQLVELEPFTAAPTVADHVAELREERRRLAVVGRDALLIAVPELALPSPRERRS